MTNQLRPNQLLRQIHYDIFKNVSGRACPILSYRVGKNLGVYTNKRYVCVVRVCLRNAAVLRKLESLAKKILVEF